MGSVRTAVCLLTGSVESAAAALFAQRQGYKVIGAFIQNKFSPKAHNDNLLQRAAYTCDKLNIPLHEVTLPPEGWEEFESQALSEYKRGGVPDIPVLFTRYILFGSAYRYLQSNAKIGPSLLVTGHFARTYPSATEFGSRPPAIGDSVQLLRSVDLWNDETHTLSQMPQKVLQNTIFPLGEIAREALPRVMDTAGLRGLADMKIRSKIEPLDVSAEDFNMQLDTCRELTKMMPSQPGRFVNIETGRFEDSFSNFHDWYIGQTVDLGSRKMTVAKRDLKSNTIALAPSADHPSLYTETLFLSLVHWIWHVPYNFYEKQMMNAVFRLCSSRSVSPCTLTVGMNNESCGNDHVILSSPKPITNVIPGQFCSLYQGELCLGSGRILRSGPSLYAMNFHKYKQTEQKSSRLDLWRFFDRFRGLMASN